MTEMVFQRYCAIEGRQTEKRITAGPKKSCFFAYAFEPPYGDIIAEAARGLEDRGYRLEVPKRSNTERGLLFCGVICPMMMRSKVVIGEVTDLNQNVAFELGYAEGLGNHVYLFRNVGIKPIPSFLDSAGIYLNEYETPAEIVDNIVRREAEFDLPPEPIFDGRGITPTEKTVALLMPRHVHYRNVIEPALRRCVANHKLTIAEPHRGGVDLQATYRTLKGAEWVLGVLAGDDFASSRALNAEVAYLLGLATASGKKVIVLQQEPVKKPMIDLAGLQERFSHVADLPTVLARRLDAAPKKTIERMDLRPGSQDSRDLVRELSRETNTAAADFFATLTGETRESQMVSQARVARERRPEPPPPSSGSTAPPADDDDFELNLDPEASDVKLGGDSAIDLTKAADSGINLSAGDSGISLNSDGDDSSEFELTLDDGTPSDEGSQVIALEENSDVQGDIFETDFELPAEETEVEPAPPAPGLFDRLFGRKKKS